MKNGYLYTVIFMLVITLILTTALALANSGFAPLIASNEALAEKRAVLDAFGLAVSGDRQSDETLFAKNIRQAQNSRGQQLFVRLDEKGSIAGLAVPFTGAGLWGGIRGYLALSPELDTLQGIVFTEQNETPGLGGRIDEVAYRDQFRDLLLASGQPLAYGAPGYEDLDAITGATSTSRAVLQIINQFIEQELPGIADGLEVVP